MHTREKDIFYLNALKFSVALTLHAGPFFGDVFWELSISMSCVMIVHSIGLFFTTTQNFNKRLE